MQIIDTYRHKGLRKKLMEKLATRPYANAKVIEAMSDIPRHVFVDKAFTEHVYEDKAFPIDAEQTISHPSTVLYQSALLALKPSDIVLEIGTGSGYQTLVLAKLSKYVLSIERQLPLYKKTKAILPAFGLNNIQLFYGDGYKGLPHYAPFNKIIVTAAAPEVPQKLVAQLKPNGRMIVPVNNENGSQTMIVIDKDENGKLTVMEGDEFKFVPMLQGKNR